MELTYFGLSHLRLRGRDVLVVVDPPPSTLPGLGRLHADIVVRTEGMTVPAHLQPREGHPQEVAGPGEFEVRGVRIQGISAGSTTIMRIEVDDVRVACLGRLDRQLTEEEVDRLGRVDVLAVPVGGVDALGAVPATKLINAIAPAIAVPVRYRSPGVEGTGDYDPLDKFAKEMGLVDGSWPVQPKLTLTGSMGAVEETRVVIVEPRATG
ncbi:MAG: MBL fold metallo-hydrolase [Candidatus Dormibacteria bacterium]|jgi:L-ascorbate metabolism protein UlaG (beta-lactamase superfamily)